MTVREFQEFGRKVARTRKSYGLNQTQIAVMVNRAGESQNIKTSQSAVSKIEKGTGTPPSEDLKNLIEDVLHQIRSARSPAGFKHIHEFLKVVNMPPVGHTMPLPKITYKPLGTVKELENQQRIFECANHLLANFKKGDSPTKIWMGTGSLFAQPVFSAPIQETAKQTAKQGEEAIGLEKVEFWNRLLAAMKVGRSVRHLFQPSDNPSEIFNRLTGITEMLSRIATVSDDHIVLTSSLYLTTLLEDWQELPADFLLVPGQGVIEATSQGTPEAFHGTFYPFSEKIGSKYQTRLKQLPQKEIEGSPLVRVCSVGATRIMFQGSDHALKKDISFLKNGLNVLTIPSEVTMRKVNRIYEEMGCIHERLGVSDQNSEETRQREVFRRKMKTIVDLTFNRQQYWTSRLKNGSHTSAILSQKAIQHFCRTGEIDDGTEYFAQAAKPVRMSEHEWRKVIRFTEKERKDVLNGVIDYLHLCKEHFTLYLVSSFEDKNYQLSELGYEETAKEQDHERLRPGVWWSSEETQCFFLLGSKDLTDPYAALQIHGIQVAAEMKSFFNSIAEKIRDGHPIGYNQKLQIKWLEKLRDEIVTN